MTALLRIWGREWLSIVTTSLERSRARSGDTVLDSPFRLTAMSLGFEVRSCVRVYDWLIVSVTVLTFFKRFVVSIRTSVSGPND